MPICPEGYYHGKGKALLDIKSVIIVVNVQNFVAELEMAGKTMTEEVIIEVEKDRIL